MRTRGREDELERAADKEIVARFLLKEVTALPHLPLEGTSGRVMALHDFDGALMVALLGLPPSLRFGLDSAL